MFYIPVQGTGGWKDKEWWTPESPFTTYLESFDWKVWKPKDPFIWSTDIDGASLWDYIRGKGGNDHKDWAAGGKALLYYLRNVPVKHRNLLTHSHGLQVALYAASYGIHLNSVIDIAGPVRKDMHDVAMRAKPHMPKWVHVMDEKSDKIAWAGQLFDGAWFGTRADVLADVNLKLPKISHSNLLRDANYFHFWPERILPALAGLP